MSNKQIFVESGDGSSLRIGDEPMEDNFDLNQNAENKPVLQTDAARRTEEAILNEEPSRTVRRRKKKQQLPKWQRLLWKYWPPIRFGLIILAGILLIWLLGSCVAGAFSGDPTEPSTEPSTNGTTEPSTEPTTEPTTQPTEPPTTDPFANMVDESWYDNTLFIGDSRTMGLRDYARIGNAEYFCSLDLSLFSYDYAVAYDTNIDGLTLAQLLAEKTYDKIFVNLGINEAGYPIYSIMEYYNALVTMIHTAQPEATIILQGVLNVSKDYADGLEHFAPTNINAINDEIRALADNQTIYYIDINAYFSDPNGYLESDLSTDGCHLTEEAYKEWVTYISVDVGDLGIQ